MNKIGLILLVFSFVCAVIAMLPASEPYRIRLIAAAIAFLTAAEIFGGVASLLNQH